MGNILCVPKRNKGRQSADGATGGVVSRWISDKLRRRSSKKEQLLLPSENDELLAHTDVNKLPTMVNSSFSSENILDSGDHFTKDSLASSETKESRLEPVALQLQSPIETAVVPVSPIFESANASDATTYQPVCQTQQSTVIQICSAKHTVKSPSPVLEGSTETPSIQTHATCVSLTTAPVATTTEVSACLCVISDKQQDHDVVEVEPTVAHNQTNVSLNQQLGVVVSVVDLPDDRENDNTILTHNIENHLERSKLADNNEIREIQSESAKTSLGSHDFGTNTLKEETFKSETHHDNTTPPEWLPSKREILVIDSLNKQKNVKVKGINTKNTPTDISENVRVEMKKMCDEAKEVNMATGSYSNEPKLPDISEHGDIKRIMPVAKDAISKTATLDDYQKVDVSGHEMEVATKSKSQNKSKVRSTEMSKKITKIGGLSTKSKQMLWIAPAKSFYRLDNEPTFMCRQHSLYNGVQFQLVKRKVSDFKVPQLPPLLPDVPIQLYRKSHVYGIPNVARDEARGKVTWRQIENKGSYGGQFWTSKAPVFEPPSQPLGERLLELHGSVAKMRRSWVIPQCRQIETLKLENDIYPGLWVCPDMRWRYNMDTNTERGNATNRRKRAHISKTNDSVKNRKGRQRLQKPRSKAKGGNLARWSRYDDLSSIYEDIM